MGLNYEKLRPNGAIREKFFGMSMSDKLRAAGSLDLVCWDCAERKNRVRSLSIARRFSAKHKTHRFRTYEPRRT